MRTCPLGSSLVATLATLKQPTASLRVNPANRNHHLWNNHGVWWIHLTLHLPDFTKLRVRRSLRTANLELARILRDRFLGRADFSELIPSRERTLKEVC